MVIKQILEKEDPTYCSRHMAHNYISFKDGNRKTIVLINWITVTERSSTILEIQISL